MLRYLTAGESHGKGLMAIVDGVPAGLKLKKELVDKELARRMVGYGRGGRMKIEKDRVDIIAGVRKDLTIGSPVGMFIKNKDYKIDKLKDVKCPRPGHADLAGIHKYGFKDARSVLERASARETAARVAIGSIAKLILDAFGIDVFSHVTMTGGVEADVSGLSYKKIKKEAEKSNVRSADKKAASLMRKRIDQAAKSGDTLGGSFEVVVGSAPPGLGTYIQWDKRLDANLARAVMAIPAVKAVSLGAGFESAAKLGSDVHDPISYNKSKKSFIRATNNAGGIEGGITNGAPVIVRGFMKPIATLADPMESVNINTKKASGASRERADVTAVAACSVVAEAVVAIEIASSLLDKFGGDSIKEIKTNYDAYIKSIREI